MEIDINNTSTGLRERSKRIEWIDTAKFIGIYLVILAHLPLAGILEGTNYLVCCIYTFHMPLFFFLSGYVEKKRPLKETFGKCVKRLLLPYVCFYFISYLKWCFVPFLRYPDGFSLSIQDLFLKPLAGLLLGCGFSTDYSYMLNAPLWFLIALFVCRIINSITSDKSVIIKIITCLAGVAVSIYLWKTDRFLPFSIGPAFMAMPFFYVANIIREKIKFSFNKMPNYINIICFVLGLAAVLLIGYFNGAADMNNIKFGKNPLLFYIGGFSGILMIISSSTLMPPLFAMGKYLAINTLTILAFHFDINFCIIIVNNVFKRHVLHLTPVNGPYLSTIEVIITTVFCLLLCFIVCKIKDFILKFLSLTINK